MRLATSGIIRDESEVMNKLFELDGAWFRVLKLGKLRRSWTSWMVACKRASSTDQVSASRANKRETCCGIFEKCTVAGCDYFSGSSAP